MRSVWISSALMFISLSGCSEKVLNVPRIEVSDQFGKPVATIDNPARVSKLLAVLSRKKQELVKFRREWLISIVRESDKLDFVAGGDYVRIDGISYKISDDIAVILDIQQQGK